MQNILNYYYHLIAIDLRQIKKKYIFNDDHYKYIFLPFTRSLDEAKDLFLLNLELLKINSNYHRVVLNKDNQILTFVNQKPYILLQVINITNRKILLTDLLLNYTFTSQQLGQFQSIARYDWLHLWKEKIDYFEYQINHFQNKYPILVQSIAYFIGLGENAISYVQDTLSEENGNIFMTLTISHRRVSVLDELFDYYNPLNLIIDYRVRDIAEYLKSSFYYDSYNLDDLNIFFERNKLNRWESRLLYGRLLFPSFYFDLYDEIINGYQSPEVIVKIIRRIPEYERFLYDIYIILKKYTDLPSISWIVKRFVF